MNIKAKLAIAATGIITFGPPIAYHARDVHHYPQDKSYVTNEGDGPHLHVQSRFFGEHADIPLTEGENGTFIGEGKVMSTEFSIVVDENESTFTHKHGAEKLWLGRDIVHVQRVNAAEMNAEL